MKMHRIIMEKKKEIVLKKGLKNYKIYITSSKLIKYYFCYKYQY